MLTSHALTKYSHIVQRVRQNPRLDDVCQVLVGQNIWDEPLLLAQLQMLADVPLENAGSETWAQAFRKLRRASIAALAQLDLCQTQPLETITGNITLLADVALRSMFKVTGHELAARFGYPVDETGKPLDIQVVAMGKHGAQELNVSSDIDIILLSRNADGDTSGADVQGLKRTCSNREFLSQWARQCVSLMNASTSDGFIFRVDTRLRPHGSAGPLVVEHEVLEQYLLTQGRMWERLAWLKARPVFTPVFEDLATHQQGHSAWQACVTPFVYRRYLDFTVIDALRELHALIRSERRSFEAKVHSGLHIKLARGGIRELEFWVQGQQLIRAGRDLSLRLTATLPALHALSFAGVIEPKQAQFMDKAYRLFRRIEHAVQYIDDAQTHVLSADPHARAQVGTALGFADLAQMELEISTTMNEVAQAFDGLFAQAPKSLNEEQALDVSEQTKVLMQPWIDRVQHLPVSDSTRLSINVLLAKLPSEQAPLYDRLAGFIVSISKRRTYIDLLLQHPPVLGRLYDLMAASPFAAQYLQDHPALLDELIDANSLYAPLDDAYWLAERGRLMARLNGMDEEAQLHVLRESHHAWVIRVLAQDIKGLIDVRAVSDALSAAADIALDAALCCVHAKQFGQFSMPIGLAIIAYGKLGGKELGYGSDLDIVFVYDPNTAGEPAAHYPRMVQRFISWLTMQTAAGRLFEIDTALRPNGQSGFMLTTLEAFEEYQVGTGPGPHAWLWEHQAISRARLCAGDRLLTGEIERIRERVLCAVREPEILKRELADMRLRVAQAHVVPVNAFDAKHSPGGMVDIEFAVQYIVLRHSGEFSDLRGNLGNVTLLKIAANCGLISHEIAHQTGLAYMQLRSIQHQCKLLGQPHAQIATDSAAAKHMLPYKTYIQNLWVVLGLI